MSEKNILEEIAEKQENVSGRKNVSFPWIS